MGVRECNPKACHSATERTQLPTRRQPPTCHTLTRGPPRGTPEHSPTPPHAPSPTPRTASRPRGTAEPRRHGAGIRGRSMGGTAPPDSFAGQFGEPSPPADGPVAKQHPKGRVGPAIRLALALGHPSGRGAARRCAQGCGERGAGARGGGARAAPSSRRGRPPPASPPPLSAAAIFRYSWSPPRPAPRGSAATPFPAPPRPPARPLRRERQGRGAPRRGWPGPGRGWEPRSAEPRPPR